MKKFSLQPFFIILKNKFFPSTTPYFCTYSITWRCNAHCKMCTIWEKPTTSEMSLADIKNAFAQLPSLIGIRFTGGEPFLHDDFDRIVDIVKTSTHITTILITTNGLCTDRIVNFIKNHRHLPFRMKVSLTAYGDTHDHNIGYPGAFEKVMTTLEAIQSLRSSSAFYCGINHTISDKQSYESSHPLQDLCKKLKMSYLPTIAYTNVPLYAKNVTVPVKNPLHESFISLSPETMKKIVSDLFQISNSIDSPIEKFCKQYYLKGLYNRLVLNRYTPNPRCVILKNHVRILPNGDIPVCLYNATVLGNITQTSFAHLWNSPQATSLREWVRQCKGCWQQCDIFLNLIYSSYFPCLPSKQKSKK